MSYLNSHDAFKSAVAGISGSDNVFEELTDKQKTLISKITIADRDQFSINLTPKDAKVLLRLNRNNRPARFRTSKNYADDMIHGRWSFNGDPVRFSTDGLLIDGQHRLSALAGLEDSHNEMSLEFLIVTGLDPKSQSVMDQGAKRSTGDNLGIQGIRSPKDVAAAARVYLEWTNGVMFTAKITVGGVETQYWVEENPEFVEYVYKAIKCRKDIDLPVSIYAALYAKFAQIDQQDADDFLETWATGINLHAGHPVLALRDRLARHRREKIRLSPRESIAMVILAWNAYRLNKTLVRFSRPKEGAWVKDNFPVPV